MRAYGEKLIVKLKSVSKNLLEPVEISNSTESQNNTVPYGNTSILYFPKSIDLLKIIMLSFKTLWFASELDFTVLCMYTETPPPSFLEFMHRWIEL